jgi:hypothetical protein
MKSTVFLSTIILSAVRGQGHLRSSSRNLSDSTNSTASNDGLFSLGFDYEQNDLPNTDDGSNNVTRTRSTNGCSSNQRELVIKIKTDNFGWETSWLLKGNGVTKQSPSYDSQQEYTHNYCLGVGMYQFTMKDKFKDGINGGYYKVLVQDGQSGYRVAVTGSDFVGFKKTYQIDVGQTESLMTDRDALYLEAHNTRRMDWHARYNKEYVPLKW